MTDQPPRYAEGYAFAEVSSKHDGFVYRSQSTNLVRWSPLHDVLQVYAASSLTLQEFAASSLTLQNVSKTVFVSSSSVAPAGISWSRTSARAAS